MDFRIETVKWEKDAIPAIGDDAQDVINTQLKPEEHDFFVGIMWCRFGAATPRAGSGTEEEFERAYQKWAKCQTNNIMMFFNDAAPERLSEIDIEQFEKVKLFKKRISKVGIYGVYTKKDEFKSKLRQSLEKAILAKSESEKDQNFNQSVETKLNERLKNSLSLFSNQFIEWVDRIFCKSEQITNSFDFSKEEIITVDSIIDATHSCIIKAPPQFGLTCLSHFMIKKAWSEKKKTWIYIDFSEVNISDINKHIKDEITWLNRTNVDCIVVDSWESEKNGAQKILEVLLSTYPDSRIMVMQTVPDSINVFSTTKFRNDRTFVSFNLLALPRYAVRKTVKTYMSHITQDENTVLNKLILDFEALNIHRTPMNCWTLLKVAESQGGAEHSIINRTQMIEKVLFSLFSMYKPPTYGTTPDAKDCEHVLGFFCEAIIRKEKFEFTQHEFLDALRNYCKDKLLNVDVNTLVDILLKNRILVQTSCTYIRFRASFWVYYFAAKRMYQDEEFKKFILGDKRYSKYTEIIEFYTGIDRNRNDVLIILTNDLVQARRLVDEKLGFNGVLNPLKYLKWEPKNKDIEQMTHQLSTDVLNSNVPDALKDQHADKNYNHLQPYNQDIKLFLEESSFLIYRHQLDAAARALRNSDYAHVTSRMELLKEILFGWTEISKVLFVLAPALTQQGYASFEGSSFRLDSNFQNNTNNKELFLKILQCVPENVIRYVQEPLTSDRITPLISKYLDLGSNNLTCHLVILFLISTRPHDWEKIVENYIVNVDKNSFYLVNVYLQLVGIYKYDFIKSSEDEKFNYLFKKCLAKHHYSVNNPVGTMLGKIPETALPKKETESLNDD